MKLFFQLLQFFVLLLANFGLEVLLEVVLVFEPSLSDLLSLLLGKPLLQDLLLVLLLHLLSESRVVASFDWFVGDFSFCSKLLHLLFKELLVFGLLLAKYL